MGPHLTLVWMVGAEGFRATLQEAARVHDADLIETHLASLGTHVAAGLAKGAVVLVAAGDYDAGRGLSIGVDEVVRAGEATPADLERAIARASARAIARAAREASLGLVDDGTAFALFAAALGHGASEPLFSAATLCDVIAQAVGNILLVSDRLASWAALSAPAEQLRQLVALRAAAPSSAELEGTLEELRRALDQSMALLRSIRELSFDGDSDCVDVGAHVARVADLVRGYARPWAAIEVEAADSLVARLPRSLCTWLLGSILATSIESIRGARRDCGRIVIRAFDAEGFVVIEVEDDGEGSMVDLRPALASGTPHVLLGLRDRIRRLGGEVLVDGDAGGTRVRVALPRARAGAVPELPDGWTHARDSPRRSAD